jgi:CHAT domain-containing protein
MGLAWAFRAAGCPSIVASQWKVYDEATARLMTSFYQNLKAGQRKDDALRSAMLSVRMWAQKAKTFDAPRWWAGFQVMGDTAPLSLSTMSKRSVK